VSATEIITRRRKWSAADKAALLAEVAGEGGKVGPVARRHGISESVLYGWRASIKAVAGATVDARVQEAVEFVPLGVVGAVIEDNLSIPIPMPPVPPPLRPSCGGGVNVGAIEIMLPGGVRICVDAFVNQRALSRVLRAMKVTT
jgi:transposase